MTKFYDKYAPHMVPKVSSVLKTFENRLPDLQDKCKQKYGAAPAFPKSARPASAKPASARLSAKPESAKPKLSERDDTCSEDERLRGISHATSDLQEALIKRDFDAAHRALDNGANPTADYYFRDPRQSFLNSNFGRNPNFGRSLGDPEEVCCPALCLALGAADRKGQGDERKARHVGNEPGLKEVVGRLLALGANPNGNGNEVQDDGSGGYFNPKQTFSPLQLARDRGAEVEAALLELAGAKTCESARAKKEAQAEARAIALENSRYASASEKEGHRARREATEKTRREAAERARREAAEIMVRGHVHMPAAVRERAKFLLLVGKVVCARHTLPKSLWLEKVMPEALAAVQVVHAPQLTDDSDDCPDESEDGAGDSDGSSNESEDGAAW